MINIKKTIDILVEDKKLYTECGGLFKYLIEVKNNIRNIEYHNLSRQLVQTVEIAYSNKLINLNEKSIKFWNSKDYYPVTTESCFSQN